MNTMKLVKMLCLTLVASLFMACNNNTNTHKTDEEMKESEEMKIEIQSKKKHDKAILLVTFGSSWEQPHVTYNKIIDAFKAEFTDADVYFSFTSKICINRCRAKEMGLFHRPELWFEELKNAGYTDIAVQSLHVIPGKEYTELSHNLDKAVSLAKEEGKQIKYTLSGPLLKEESDIEELAEILHNELDRYTRYGDLVCFLGHGKPEKYEIGDGNTRYVMLENILQAKRPNYYVGTVDMEGNLVEDMIKRMKSKDRKVSFVYCMPLLTVVGDHTINDMMGGTEEVPEEGSWRDVISKAGYLCDVERCIQKGLADNPLIVNIWIRQMKEAIAK